MTYFEAESMRQEMLVALQYREIVPEKYKKVAEKYTADQWLECRKAIIEKLDEDKIALNDLLKLVAMVRRGAAL
jgi:hypothetical protein